MIHLEQQNWQRIVVQGNQLPHAFVGGTSEKRICTVTGDRERIRIVPGVEGLILLKTTDSAFRGFLRDSFTTLMETDERILATKLDACWEYGATTVDWNRCFDVIWRTLVEVFANHKSLGVQHTLHAMGAAALEACAELQEISLTMLNQHRLPVDLRPFGLENPNEIFVPTEEPFGKISGTLRRS